MAVKVKIDAKRAYLGIKSSLRAIKTNKTMQGEIGQFMVDRIKGEARRGKPLNDDRSFPPLKTLTVEMRRVLADYNKTHKSFKPSKSNITLTGQLLDALIYRIKSNYIEIFIEKSRREPLKIPSGFPKKRQTVYNSTVDRQLRKRGFIMFTGKGVKSEPRVIKRINNIVKRYLRRALRVRSQLK